MLNSYWTQDKSKQFAGRSQKKNSVQEFELARTRSVWNRVTHKMTSKPLQLKELQREQADLYQLPRAEHGVQFVPVEKIVGSLSRSRDFDREFMPLNDRSRDRWVSIDRLYHETDSLPPVKLYQVGGEYYVVDGHHRISVIRNHGQLYVEAEVTRMDPAIQN